MTNAMISQLAVDYFKTNRFSVDVVVKPEGISGYGGARKVHYTMFSNDGQPLYTNLTVLEVSDIIAHIVKGLLLPGTKLRDNNGRIAIVKGAVTARGKHLFQYVTIPTHYDAYYLSYEKVKIPVTLGTWRLVD